MEPNTINRQRGESSIILQRVSYPVKKKHLSSTWQNQGLSESLKKKKLYFSKTPEKLQRLLA
jgi:hypothetical protein